METEERVKLKWLIISFGGRDPMSKVPASLKGSREIAWGNAPGKAAARPSHPEGVPRGFRRESQRMAAEAWARGSFPPPLQGGRNREDAFFPGALPLDISRNPFRVSADVEFS